MNCRKMIVLTGYRVQFVDLRQPKPRKKQEEVYTLDRDFIAALALVNMSIEEYIRHKYSGAGYCVSHVEKISGKRVVYADLREMWDACVPESSCPEQDPAPDQEDDAHEF